MSNLKSRLSKLETRTFPVQLCQFLNSVEPNGAPITTEQLRNIESREDLLRVIQGNIQSLRPRLTKEEWLRAHGIHLNHTSEG